MQAFFFRCHVLLDACLDALLQSLHIRLKSGRFGSRVPRFRNSATSMGRQLVPARRIRFKTAAELIPAKAAQKRRKAATFRMAAVKEGIVPKARKAFAIYLKEKNQVARGASKEKFLSEMRRLAKAWKTLSCEDKNQYREASKQEFQMQRVALAAQGIKLRGGSHAANPVQQAPPVPCAQQSKVGPYCLDNVTELGAGTYGSVYHCQHLQTGVNVALKVYRSKEGKDDCAYELAQLKRLQQKLAPHQRLWLPVVVEANASGRPWPWLATELCGPSLLSVLHNPDSDCRRKPTTWSIAAQLQSALRAMHSVDVAHLDVKPSNVLWCPARDLLKLCDFGMCESLARSASSTASPRYLHYVTPAYRPPELWQCNGSSASALTKLLTPAVDIWSYGCVLFEVDSGHHLMTSIRNDQGAAMVRKWCQQWSQLSSLAAQGYLTKCGARHQSWATKLLRAPNWVSVVLQTCAPDSVERKWPDLERNKHQGVRSQ